LLVLSPHRGRRARHLNEAPQPRLELVVGNAGARIIHCILTGSTQNFFSQIGVRLQIALFGQHHEHGFTGIDERPALDLIEEPFSQVGWDISLEAQAAGAGLGAQGFGLLNAVLPCRLVIDVIGRGVGHGPHRLRAGADYFSCALARKSQKPASQRPTNPEKRG
jgi:hypothetical protein